jgi:GNAT superfamily N-acetyltransferase
MELVKALDEDLARRDGDDHAFFAQFNKTNMIRHVIVAYDGGMAVGCGAFKYYDDGTMEVKRMYTSPAHRKKGIATALLKELEIWIKELGIYRAVLETGRNQPEAIAMYVKNGYKVIPNYGQYSGVESSICFEKMLGS